jgi:hypothetical protein
MMRLRSLIAANVNRRLSVAITSGVAYRLSAPVADGFLQAEAQVIVPAILA